MISVEKPGTPEELVHFGVKGMRWGVRKEREASDSSATKGLEHFSKSQAKAMGDVAKMTEKAYGFKIHEFIPQTEAEDHQHLSIVHPKRKGEIENRISVTAHPRFKEVLLDSQNQGYLVHTDPKRAIEGNLTHESAHGLFHANDSSGKGVKYAKNARMTSLRDSAWKSAETQAIKDGHILPDKNHGDPHFQMIDKISKYASSSPYLEEYEAEMFTAYHWSPNPPKFVDAFMNDIHRQMGITVKPFSGRKAHA